MCERPLKMGPGMYEGRAVNVWDILVCDRCYRGNEDGIVTSRHPKLIAHLERSDLPYKLNEEGYLSWPKG
ncbi:hypothetical protein ASG17_07655 [Brevundimonas sp. Leaf363]|nr:hypothetical protein ASG17_07655 [Brevundimonas sp. Leaf363]